MPVTCRLLNAPPTHADYPLEPGSMWYEPAMTDGLGAQVYASHLSVQYDNEWRGKRPPISVVLPDGSITCVDMRRSEQEHADMREGPHVLGDPPEITIRGKIVTENYVGYLRRGVFSDDEQGRTYKVHEVETHPQSYGATRRYEAVKK
jgi:hypothetical protein